MRQPRRRSTALTMICLALLASCSYPRQPPGLLVTTSPPGASCVVSRGGQPLAVATPTPAIARVEPKDGPLSVTCRRQGFADVTVPVVSGQSPAVYPESIDVALMPQPPGVRPPGF